MTERYTLHWKPGASAAPLPPLADPSGVTQEEQPMVTMATLLSNYNLQFDPPDYQLVIEDHPTPVPGNQFQLRVLERHPSSLHEERIQ